MSKVVTGVYREKESVTEAVEMLMSEGVPVDDISVILKDDSGKQTAQLEVKEDSGASEGAWKGGAVGASLGGLGVVLVATGIVIAPGVSLAVAGPILAGMVVGGATAGVAIGAPWGLGHWKGLDDIPAEELEQGVALVAVHSDNLAETARRVFEETGANAIGETEEPDTLRSGP